VSPATDLLAQCHPKTPPVLTDNTLLPASPHRAAIEHITVPVRTVTAP
jgi:hypothetical protein